MELNIVHHPRVSCSNALHLTAKCWVELQDNKFIDNIIPLKWEYETIVANFEGKAIGVITYQKLDYRNTIWVQMSYVLPKYRHQGVYTAMWNALVEKAKELRMPLIEGGVHANNVAMITAAKRLGREPSAIIFAFEVPNS